MKNLVAAMLIGMTSVAAFAQLQVTAPQAQITAPKLTVPQVQVTAPQAQVTTPQADPLPGAAMAPAHDAGNSEDAHAEHKHHRHHHHKKAMELDAQK